MINTSLSCSWKVIFIYDGLQHLDPRYSGYLIIRPIKIIHHQLFFKALTNPAIIFKKSNTKITIFCFTISNDVRKRMIVAYYFFIKREIGCENEENDGSEKQK